MKCEHRHEVIEMGDSLYGQFKSIINTEDVELNMALMDSIEYAKVLTSAIIQAQVKIIEIIMQYYPKLSDEDLLRISKKLINSEEVVKMSKEYIIEKVVKLK